LQAFWKHSETLDASKWHTWLIALPNMFCFNFLLPLFSPWIDLLFLGSLILYGLSQFHFTRIPQLYTGADVQRTSTFYRIHAVDFLTCVIAFTLEKRETGPAVAAAAARFITAR